MKIFVALIVFLSFGLFTSYFLQVNSKRGFVGESLCSKYEVSGPHCKYSFKSGFPFTYYEVDKNIKFETEDACFNYGTQCLSVFYERRYEKIPVQQTNVKLFFADVAILGVILALIPFVIYWFLSSVLKIPFRVSWLLISIALSVVFNIVSLTPVAFIAIPILGFVAILITGPILSAVGIGSTRTLQTIEFLLLPLLFGTFIFYLIIWGFWKIKNR